MSTVAQLAAQHAEIDAFLSSKNAELIEFVRLLISIDSQIPPYADEREIARVLMQTHDAIGLGRGSIVGPSPERPSLLTRILGSEPTAGKNFMLNGHIDTKPVGEARHLWRTDPFGATIIDGDIYGLGSNDMKAAVAAMTYAAYALRETGVELQGDLLLAFVADEEGGGQHGSKYLAPLVENIDCGLIGEPSGWSEDWQGIHLVSRGVCGFRIRVTGTQRHSSLSDRVPNVNASLKVAGLMTRMADELELSFEPHVLGGIGPTLNPGVLISGGTYFGVIPGEAEFACDLRTVPGMTEEGVRGDLKRWLDACRAEDPDLIVNVTFEPGLSWVPWCEIPAAHPLVAVTQQAAADVLGESPPLSVFPGGTDAAWFSDVGIPTLASFGPGMLTSAHGPNEFVSVQSVIDAARMYARIVLGVCS